MQQVLPEISFAYFLSSMQVVQFSSVRYTLKTKCSQRLWVCLNRWVISPARNCPRLINNCMHYTVYFNFREIILQKLLNHRLGFSGPH